MASKNVKIVVFAPESCADKVRQAIAATGGGKINKYSSCSFSTKGIGRFRPEKDAHPAVGKIGRLESVKEERIEIRCSRKFLKKVVLAIKKSHIYEEVAIDIYALED
ncbi:hypothetical protein L6250_04075 [Candidatus Parcubacteria bacterium]|nr:hypothetical protein [Patescibacteria group bacterium]MBU4467082.1 hypothetical protein [Patescibacteria group bacterium]MCG2688777.1 hypothetical protein [Candidatus Parcubacteria bacterium]